MATPLEQILEDASHGKLFWLFLGVLVVAQVIAFWMLCSQQVRNAEVRHVAAQQQRTAPPAGAVAVNYYMR